MIMNTEDGYLDFVLVNVRLNLNEKPLNRCMKKK